MAYSDLTVANDEAASLPGCKSTIGAWNSRGGGYAGARMARRWSRATVIWSADQAVVTRTAEDVDTQRWIIRLADDTP